MVRVADEMSPSALRAYARRESTTGNYSNRLTVGCDYLLTLGRVFLLEDDVRHDTFRR